MIEETNLALLEFLGIDPSSGVTRIEVVAVPHKFPVVTVTWLLGHSTWENETRMFKSTWENETRMFKLVPYSTPE
jgi:hypothetical protein